MAAHVYFTPLPAEPYFTYDMHARQAARDKLYCLGYESDVGRRLYDQLDQKLKSLHGIGEEYQLFLIRPSAFSQLILNCYPGMDQLGVYNRPFFNSQPIGSGVQNDLPGLVLEGKQHNWDKLPAGTPVLLGMDDPYTGETVVDIDERMNAYPTLIDLSFSYPLGLDAGLSWDILLIQANGAMGVPLPLLLGYINKNLPGADKNFRMGSDISAYELYILEKVIADYAEKGLEMINRELRYKKAVIDHALTTAAKVGPIDVEHPSSTMIQFKPGGSVSDVLDYFYTKGMVLYNGQQRHLVDTLIISNYPTHSKEQMEMLADLIALI